MKGDLKIFRDEINKKTGINFSVYDKAGALVLGEEKNIVNFPLNFDGIILDSDENLTFFTFRFKANSFVGVLMGSSEEEKNYAFLLSELAQGAHAKGLELSKSEFVKATLFGEVNFSQVAKYTKKYGISDKPVFAMLLTANDKAIQDILSVLKTYMSSSLGEVVDIDENQLVLIKFIDDESLAYQSSGEYAEYLARLIYEETGAHVKICVGTTVTAFSSLSQSYQQALATCRMSGDLKNDSQVYCFNQFVLTKIIEDMPKYKTGEYLDILLDANAKEVLSDPEMLITAEEFLANNLNVSETSRKLYLHRNTLSYRLDKIEKATGLNIRKFSDAVTFRLITILSKFSR